MLQSPLLPARRFLWLTAGLLVLCALLIPFFDQPLARFCHYWLPPLQPFFHYCTTALDAAYGAAVMTCIFGVPALFGGLLLAYLVGRWRRQPWALVFAVTLFTHVASTITVNVLKVALRRLRPEVLFTTGYPDLGFRAAPAANSDSFPSGHVACYLSLFLPVALLFPRWRFPLLLVPTLIGLGRLVLGAHYLSDVLFAAWVVSGYTFLFGQLFRLPWLTGAAGPPRPAT